MKTNMEIENQNNKFLLKRYFWMKICDFKMLLIEIYMLRNEKV